MYIIILCILAVGHHDKENIKFYFEILIETTQIRQNIDFVSVGYGARYYYQKIFNDELSKISHNINYKNNIIKQIFRKSKAQNKNI